MPHSPTPSPALTAVLLLPTASSAELTPAARRLAVLGVVAAHLVAGWGLMQVDAVRQAVGEMAPLMVELIAPPAPPAVLPPALPPEPVRPQPKAPAPPLLSVAPAPAPAAFETPAPPPEPPAPAPVVVVEAPPAPATPPAPPAQPKTIAISSVAYLTPPVLIYPATSRRYGESGRAHVRVLVDAEGLARQMQLLQSSGFQRLDESALATVRATRFKPYTENGQPQAFWVVMPLVFELEK